MSIRTTEVKRRNFSVTVETFFDQFGEVDTTRDAFHAMPIHPVFQREKLYVAIVEFLTA